MPQVKPTPRPDLDPIADLVIQDILERKRIGIETYGTPLTAFNGRRALQDAYEECLDQANYLKQRLVEEASIEEAIFGNGAKGEFDSWFNRNYPSGRDDEGVLYMGWLGAWYRFSGLMGRRP